MSKSKKESPVLTAFVIVLAVILLTLLFIRYTQNKSRINVPEPHSSSGIPLETSSSSGSSSSVIDPQNERWKDVTVVSDEKKGTTETTFSSADDVAKYTVIENEQGKRNIAIAIDGAKAAQAGNNISFNDISTEKLQNLVDIYAEKYTDGLIERDDMQTIAKKIASSAAMQYFMGKDKINTVCDVGENTIEISINRDNGDISVNITEK